MQASAEGSYIVLPLNDEKTRADCLFSVNGKDFIVYIEEINQHAKHSTPVIQISWNLKSILVCNQTGTSLLDLKSPFSNKFLQNIAKLISESSSEASQHPTGKGDFLISAKILDQIEHIGWDKLVGVSSDFSEISLQALDKANRQHVLNVKLKSGNLEFIADFPLSFAFTWDEDKTVKDIYESFLNQIEDFQEFWDVMEELDNACWVLEPENPSRKATYRKIAVVPNVSLKIDVDPKHPRLFPAITWLGSESMVFSFREKVLDRIEVSIFFSFKTILILIVLFLQLWENVEPIHSNLERLLDLTLPSKEERKDDVDNYDLTCCICYTERLNGEVPSKTCDNPQCGQSFHNYCLYEWLRSLIQTRRQGNKVFGTCPVCEQPISCKPPENQ
uniref:EOG090X0G12 n=1 Tax=Moina brachiata TaxID=675436 RepID=A0A4Y7NM54_9CRUS|nr:EOG090X0G12 [Moina brachiata]